MWRNTKSLQRDSFKQQCKEKRHRDVVSIRQTETGNDLNQQQQLQRGAKYYERYYETQTNMMPRRTAMRPNKDSLCDVNRRKHTKRQSKH